MWSRTSVFLVLLASGGLCAHIRERRLAQGSDEDAWEQETSGEFDESFCGSKWTETQTPFLFVNDEDLSCDDLISGIPDLYNKDYRETCRYWLCLDELPKHVENVKVIQCLTFKHNDTIKYRATVCCNPEDEAAKKGKGSAEGSRSIESGTSEAGKGSGSHESDIGGPRCFSCSGQPAQRDDDQPKSLWPNGYHTDHCNYNSGRECVEQCQKDEVCQTLVTYDSDNEWGVYSKSCASRESCLALANNGKCRDRVDDPQCAYCCEQDYCNYNHTMKRLIAGGACAEPNPCHHDGACSLGPGGTPICACLPGTYGKLCEKTECDKEPCKNRGRCSWQRAAPYYTCSCRAAYSGAICNEHRSLCDQNLCSNGGTCYNYGGSDYRCSCPEGFVGTRCERKRPLGCMIPSHHFLFPESHTDLPTHCSLYDSVVAAKKEAYSRACVRYMGEHYGVARPYEDGRDGGVEEVELAGLGRCESGSRTMFYQISVCCHACLSAPCQNGGYCVGVEGSDQGEFACKCRHGYGGRFCENRLAKCLAFGDVHYHSFDQRMYHFQGPCKYELVVPTQDADMPNFKVLVKNEHRGDNTHVSFTSYVEVQYEGKTVRIGPGRTLTVNGAPTPPGATYGGLTTSINGLFLRVQTDFGLVVEFNGNWIVSVFLPDKYMGAIEGLCGNFNRNPGDDLTTKEGVDVSEAEDGEWTFGTSYQVQDVEELLCHGVWQPPNNCSEEEEEAMDQNFCGLILDEDDANNPFLSCIRDKDVNAAMFFESCVYDFCHLEDKKAAACGALQAFATQCQGFGYVIDWRDYANCPQECSGGSSYSYLASACTPTCADQMPTCTLDDTEACVCPEGQLLKDGQCIEPKECGCLDANNVRRSFGDEWLSADCGTMYTCSVCEGCSSVAEITEEATDGCPGTQVCVATRQVGEGMCQHKRCVDDYGVEHADGSQWTDEDCDVWRCLSGEILRQQSGCPPNHKCMLLSSGQYGCKREGCQDDNGKWYEIGDVWKSSDCLSELKCAESGLISQAVEGCAEDEECVSLPSAPAVYFCRKYTCTDGYGRVHKLGEYWNNYDCSIRYYCDKGGIAEDRYHCPLNQECVSGECRPVKPAWREWSAWSACEADGCSPGRRSRDRVCYPLGSDCGSAPSTEVEDCACTGQYVPADCQFCKGNESGQGFLENKCDCTKYFHCVRHTKWTMYPMSCGPCTRWDQSKLTCVRVDYDCHGPDVPGEDPTITQHEDFCEYNGQEKRREDPDDITKYQLWVYGGWQSMPCAPGTRFFRNTCGCDHYAHWIAPPTPREITCLDFTDNFQGSRYVYVKVKGVTKTEGLDGDGAWFNGFSYLNIPFFNNNDRPYSVSLWYSRGSASEEEDQTLVMNTDCKLQASFRLLLKTPELLEARVITTDAAQEASVSAKVARDGWHHVVMVYSSGRVILYVDGVRHVSVSKISGAVKAQQCPLWIGGGDGVGFTGAMDEICIFRSVLTDTQVQELYSKRPQQLA